ncbi:MAG: Pvc16 protein, partial [Euryarchaeota archaeon]|nr:Pvc16 protein [Euryarchaeota archaeon]
MIIDDLSLTLKTILEDPTDPTLPDPLKSVEIVFDRPDDKFSPQRNTVDLFLY